MKRFDQFADWASELFGSSVAFIFALLLVVVWAATGPIFHFSANWQLFINTSTTVITFLMIFLVQSSQNADTEAIQRKLDKLLEQSDDVDPGDLIGTRKERRR